MKSWLWQFGRGKPRLRGLSVASTEELRIAAVKGALAVKKAVATRVKRSHKAPKAAAARGGME